MWPEMIVEKKRKKPQAPDSGGWVSKKQERSKFFIPEPTKISASKVDSPMIASMINKKPKVAGDGGNGKALVPLAKPNDDSKEVEMDVKPGDGKPLLLFEPPFSDTSTPAAAAEGKVRDEFQLDAESEEIIIKRCIDLGILRPLNPSNQSRRRTSQPISPPLCLCDNARPAILSSCKRKGSKHFGRSFFKCGLEDVPRQCTFMLWLDNTPPVASDFTASATFTGPKRGYVFKSGKEGLGYYKDWNGNWKGNVLPRTPSPSVGNQKRSQRKMRETKKNKTTTVITTAVPKCRCNDPALLRTCASNKNGNLGRKYYVCSKPREDKCNFFEWADVLQSKVDAFIQEKTGLPPRPPTPEVTAIVTSSEPKIQAMKVKKNMINTAKWACQQHTPHPKSLEAKSSKSTSTSPVSKNSGGGSLRR